MAKAPTFLYFKQKVLWTDPALYLISPDTIVMWGLVSNIVRAEKPSGVGYDEKAAGLLCEIN